MYFIIRAKLGQLPDKFFGKLGPYASFSSAKAAMELFEEQDPHYIYMVVRGRIRGEADDRE